MASSSQNEEELVDRRVQVYGDPLETFERIAQVWSGILGHTVKAVEVPLLMAGMKLVRTQVMPDYSDNSDDIDGYLYIFRTLVGDDMIHARTVAEFVDKKWPEQMEVDLNRVAMPPYDPEMPGYSTPRLTSFLNPPQKET